MEDKVYEHEVVTTVRVTVRSLNPYLNESKFLEEYAWMTDFSDFLQSDDYPRVVATTVVEDDVEYLNREVDDA